MCPMPGLRYDPGNPMHTTVAAPAVAVLLPLIQQLPTPKGGWRRKALGSLSGQGLSGTSVRVVKEPREPRGSLPSAGFHEGDEPMPHATGALHPEGTSEIARV